MLYLFFAGGTVSIGTSSICIFGVKASQKTYEQSLKIVTDVSDILASGELNLATAGDRYKILHNISENVKNLKLWLLAIKLRLEKANRLGFWNSINPFAGYINTDKGIVENIMNRYKRNFYPPDPRRGNNVKAK
jgi:hypothetical protein